jgi:hypothetical protein
VVEHLPHKYKFLSSNSNTATRKIITKKKTKKKENADNDVAGKRTLIHCW